jgi:hypothetical protein
MANEPATRDPNRVIRASELGAYVYCAHAWWLGSEEGLPSQNVRALESGEKDHERHGRRLVAGALLARLSYLLLILAGLAGLGWLVHLLAP